MTSDASQPKENYDTLLEQLAKNQPLDRANRTYYVSDERLRKFRKLTPLEKLRWQEEIGTLLRLAQIGRERERENLPKKINPLPSAPPKG